MEPLDNLAHLRRELDAFAAQTDGDLDVAVPSCPGWDVQTLISHVGQVQRFALLQLDAGPGADLDLNRPPAPTGAEAVVAWYLEGATLLFETLERTDPSEHRPNWAGAPTSAFWFRRMTQEMAIHRWDIEAAHGVAAPIDPAVAVDGVDEIGDLFMGRIDPAELGGGGRVIHLHATDTEGEWLFTLGDEALSYEHGHAKGEVAARGTASDLLLMLWNRVPASKAEQFGDTELLDRFLDALSGI